MRLDDINKKDVYVAFQPMYIIKNSEKLAKPFENAAFSAHFVFSYGHLLLNAGYESNINYVFFMEEPY